MEYRSLEINVISAKDLKKVNLIGKTHAYAVVSISADPRASQQQRTAVDRSGNASPTWNFTVKFAVNESAARSNGLAVTFRIRCERRLGDKDIGEVHVPLSELIGSVEDGKSQFVTYQVRKPSGKPRGELNFSYKWGEKIAGARAPITAYQAQVGSSSAYPPPPMGYSYQSPGRSYPSASAVGYRDPPPQPGNGYPPVQQPQQPPRNNKFEMGTRLLGGALAGLLLHDVLSDDFGHHGSWGGVVLMAAAAVVVAVVVVVGKE
ncbi:hypothetical protein RHSIM_Rhsim02G0010900 [Rhododendron simsii]|uniref:C2 domain-containing protein n=1 Tax=Rhododendron simsii TaxID=118357 RepID=A0A834HKA6_RHOSS|nr:hypothetical protein RHSIM_Rhsim02G0010900 [Rhododendron simsii]